MSDHTPFLQVCIQRHAMDCSVACLAMLLGVSYEVALLAMRTPAVITSGAQTKHILAAAKRLKKPLKFCRKFDIETDTGILGVSSPQWPSEHVVVLKDGLIVDTDACIYEADIFLSIYQARPVSLLTFVD